MPRRAPTSVQEFRVTLGDFERREVKQVLDELEKTTRITRYGMTAAAGGAVVVGGLGAYALWSIAMGSAGLIDRALSLPKRAFNFVTGKADSLWDDVFDRPPVESLTDDIQLYKAAYPDMEIQDILILIAEDKIKGKEISRVDFVDDYSEYKRLSELWGFYEPRPQAWQYEEWHPIMDAAEYANPQLSYPAALNAWEVRRREAERRYLDGLVTEAEREQAQQEAEQGAYIDEEGKGQREQDLSQEGLEQGTPVLDVPDVVLSIFPQGYDFSKDELGLLAASQAGQKLEPQAWTWYYQQQ